MLELLFNKIATKSPVTLLRKRLRNRGVFLWICKISKNTFYIEHLRLLLFAVRHLRAGQKSTCCSIFHHCFVLFLSLRCFCPVVLIRTCLYQKFSCVGLTSRYKQVVDKWLVDKVSLYDVSVFHPLTFMTWFWLMLHCLISH